MATAALAGATAATAATASHNLPNSGKKYYQTYPFGLGKKVTVSGITYTMGRDGNGMLGGKPTSGVIYGWADGGVVIYLINPTG